MPNLSHNLDPVFHALADPTRRAVLARLGEGAASIKELHEPFDMALPSFLQHVQVLEKSGLVKSEKIGRVRTCHLQQQRLTDAEKWFQEQRSLWERRLDRLEEFLDQDE